MADNENSANNDLFPYAFVDYSTDMHTSSDHDITGAYSGIGKVNCFLPFIAKFEG